jgi:hypothetical protein
LEFNPIKVAFILSISGSIGLVLVSRNSLLRLLRMSFIGDLARTASDTSDAGSPIGKPTLIRNCLTAFIKFSHESDSIF